MLLCKLYFYMCVCATCVQVLLEVSDALKLALQGLVSGMAWILGTELGFSAGAGIVVNPYATSPAPLHFISVHR